MTEDRAITGPEVSGHAHEWEFYPGHRMIPARWNCKTCPAYTFDRPVPAPDLGGDMPTTLRKLTEANTAMAQRLSAANELIQDVYRARAIGDLCAFCGGYATHKQDCVGERVDGFLVSPDAVVQARADAVRGVYGFAMAVASTHDPDGNLGDLIPNARHWAIALREAFPELQS